MSDVRENTAALIERYYAAFNAMDIDAILDCLTDDVAHDINQGARETGKDCLKREIKEELPKLKLGRLSLWKEVTAKNKRSGRRMSDAIFIAKNAKGRLSIGDKKEIDRAAWQNQAQFATSLLVKYGAWWHD